MQMLGARTSLLRLMRLALPILRSAVPQLLALSRDDGDQDGRDPGQLEGLATDIGLKVAQAIIADLSRVDDVIDAE